MEKKALKIEIKNRPNILSHVSAVIGYIISCIGLILYFFIIGTVFAVSFVWDWIRNNKGV